jgi:hypothetical protein
MNGSFALGVLAPWPAGFPAAEGGGSFVKLVQRLARLGELLRALAGPAAALGVPRKWS